MRTDPVVPDGWWATGIDGARGLYEVFGRRPASLEGAVCTLMQFDPFPLNLSVVVELADAPRPAARALAPQGVRRGEHMPPVPGVPGRPLERGPADRGLLDRRRAGR